MKVRIATVACPPLESWYIWRFMTPFKPRSFVLKVLLLCLAGSAYGPLLSTAAEVTLPTEVRIGVAERKVITVSGTLPTGGVVRIGLRYSPSVIRILGARGEQGMAMPCIPMTIVENRVESATQASFIVECPFSNTTTNGPLFLFDVEGIAGLDSLGTISATLLSINGSLVSDAILTTCNVVRTGGQIARPEKMEGILGNYPNPFASSTSIIYSMIESGVASFVLLDMQGRRILDFPPERATAGENSLEFAIISWEVPSGSYLVQMNTERGTYFHPITVMK